MGDETKKIQSFCIFDIWKNSFKTANSFAKKSAVANVAYITWAYTKEEDNRKFFMTKDMNDFLEEIGVDWYEDIHSEIMLKDCLYPQNIYGVLEIDYSRNNISLIINPYLYAMFLVKEENNKLIDYKKVLKK